MARVGRPTKLTDEMKEQAYAYLESCSGLGVNTLLPTIEGLALELHCHRDSMYEWASVDEEFSDILEELKQAQAQKIMQNSMLNRYNPTISKLMLSKHGYIEQKDITSAGEKINDAVPMTTEEIDAELTKLLDRRKAAGNPVVGSLPLVS